MNNWLDAIIDYSYDGLFVCDHEGRVIRINKASERLSGVSSEAVVGRTMKELIAQGLYDRSVTMEVLKNKSAVTLMQQVRGGKKFLITGNPIFNEHGDIIFVVTNSRDIEMLDHLKHQIEATQYLAKRYISKLPDPELETNGIDSSNIILSSEDSHRVVNLALRVAKVDSTVLLMGNSGVGKGMIAKLLHKHSRRSRGPFIRVDCAGIPDSLIESELFGYNKGAFTGARIEGKPGLFELADKGTLFLDEICEIPLSSQAKLLRFLEDHEVVRLGGAEPRRIDVRIIAATNRDIEKMVSSNLFREDLYYRISVVPIHIPALKERRQDVLPLVSHFLHKFNLTYQKDKTFSPQTLNFLHKYDFPGNIRELANLIERLVVVTEKDRIEPEDLPSHVTAPANKRRDEYPFFEGLSLQEALEECESRLIEQAIKKY
ncbi:MAG: sigma 54-interacting transcriptional regulator, partial [Deltaproteobacteria bacterium]|nr:sigma 54-interacting transcriptional regulator [Deltaproteobacteria bacterium]